METVGVTGGSEGREAAEQAMRQRWPGASGAQPGWAGGSLVTGSAFGGVTGNCRARLGNSEETAPQELTGELRLLWEEQVETELGSRLPEGHVQCGEAEQEATVRAAGAPGEPWALPHLTPGPLSLRRPSPRDCCLPAGPHGKPREGRLSQRPHSGSRRKAPSPGPPAWTARGGEGWQGWAVRAIAR